MHQVCVATGSNIGGDLHAPGCPDPLRSAGTSAVEEDGDVHLIMGTMLHVAGDAIKQACAHHVPALEPQE